MHISDWFPTLCDLAGIDYEVDGVQELDGFSQLDNILNGESDPYQPRELLIHNIQPNDCNEDVCGAIRWRNYKIIVGNELKIHDECGSKWCSLDSDIDDNAMTVQCSETGNFDSPDLVTDGPKVKRDCGYSGTPCLFDIDSDPCEYTDLRKSEPEIYEKMYNLLLQYNETQKLPTLYSQYPDDYEGANPELYGGFWSPWVNTSNYTTINGESFEFMVEDTSKIHSVSKKHSWHLVRQYMHSLLPAF